MSAVTIKENTASLSNGFFTPTVEQATKISAKSRSFEIKKRFTISFLYNSGNQACEEALHKILFKNLSRRLYSIISDIYKKSTCRKDNQEFIKIDSSFFKS